MAFLAGIIRRPILLQRILCFLLILKAGLRVTRSRSALFGLTTGVNLKLWNRISGNHWASVEPEKYGCDEQVSHRGPPLYGAVTDQ